jgi:hypothetical protein
MDYGQFLAVLKSDFNLQAYGLEEGYLVWEQSLLSCTDFTAGEFSWLDNDGAEVRLWVSVTLTPSAWFEGEVAEFVYSYEVAPC